MKIRLLLALGAGLLAASLMAQDAVLGNGVYTMQDGALTAQIMGPEVPCPPVLEWLGCSALNTIQVLWVWAASTDESVTQFNVTVKYTSSGAAGSATATIAAAPGGAMAGQLFSLPVNAVDVAVTVDSVALRQRTLVRRPVAVGR